MSERRRSRRARSARAAAASPAAPRTPAADAPAAPSPRLAMLAWAALFVLVVALYTPTLRAEFVNWDDELHVTQNTRITGPHGLRQAWTDTGSPGFYPVTYTTWWVEWRAADGK